MTTDPRDVRRSADGEAEHCWRMSLAIRIGTGVAFLGIGLLALIDTATSGFPITDPLPMIALFAALWWFGTMRPAVCLTADKLIVRNPLWTHRIARDNVVSAKPSYFGVVIRRRAGRPCIALALQKANVAEWTGRQVRADRAARMITRWAASAL